MIDNDMRDRLIKLIISAKRVDPETGSFTEFLADHLIANGVVLRERGEWIHYDIDIKLVAEDTGNILYSECSQCKYQITSKLQETHYCPNCGAKMDGREEK